MMEKPPRPLRLWPMVVGMLVFAVLLAGRTSLSSMWARAAVAGLAAMALGVGIRSATWRNS